MLVVKLYLKSGKKFMSRLGKYPIKIASGVTVSNENGFLLVKGPKGELKRSLNNAVDIKVTGDEVQVSMKSKSLEFQPLWGTFASHINNMITGVTKGFEKKLQIEGIGYKGEVKGKDLVLNIGFSHPVVMNIPENLNVTLEKGIITISGIDKDSVGAFAAKVRELKKPEPYKGKGIRYQGEHVEIKQGKKSV